MPQVQFRIINFKLAHQQQSILSTDGQWFKPQGCKKLGQQIEANNWFQVVEFKFPRSQTTRYHMQYISKISKTYIYIYIISQDPQTHSATGNRGLSPRSQASRIRKASPWFWKTNLALSWLQKQRRFDISLHMFTWKKSCTTLVG